MRTTFCPAELISAAQASDLSPAENVLHLIAAVDTLERRTRSPHARYPDFSQESQKFLFTDHTTTGTIGSNVNFRQNVPVPLRNYRR